jgi:hypothetical protein
VTGCAAAIFAVAGVELLWAICRLALDWYDFLT